MKSFEEVMTLTRTVSSSTAFEDEECRALYDLCATVSQNGLVVEIGCQLGRTSSIILQVAKEIGYTSVHIDPWTVQPDFAASWHQMAWNVDVPHVVLQMRTDQALELQGFLRGIDLLLIDGDHTEHGVRIDTRMADRVRTGGILCAHDYGRNSLPDVWKVMSEYAVLPKWGH